MINKLNNRASHSSGETLYQEKPHWLAQPNETNLRSSKIICHFTFLWYIAKQSLNFFLFLFLLLFFLLFLFIFIYFCLFFYLFWVASALRAFASAQLYFLGPFSNFSRTQDSLLFCLFVATSCVSSFLLSCLLILCCSFQVVLLQFTIPDLLVPI